MKSYGDFRIEDFLPNITISSLGEMGPYDVIWSTVKYIHEKRQELRNSLIKTLDAAGCFYRRSGLYGTSRPKKPFIMERMSRRLFEKIFKTKFIKVRPPWLRGYELDGYSEKLKLAFEYEGPQHYKPISFFCKTRRFEDQKRIDLLKKLICGERGIRLVLSPYWIKRSQLENFIIREVTITQPTS